MWQFIIHWAAGISLRCQAKCALKLRNMNGRQRPWWQYSSTKCIHLHSYGRFVSTLSLSLIYVFNLTPVIHTIQIYAFLCKTRHKCFITKIEQKQTNKHKKFAVPTFWKWNIGSGIYVERTVHFIYTFWWCLMFYQMDIMVSSKLLK